MKASVYVNDSYVKPDHTSRMYLRIFLGKKYIKIPLDIYVKANDFDKKKQRITKGPNKNTFNKLIEDALGRTARVSLKFQVNNKTLTPNAFKKEFERPDSLEDVYDFLDTELENTRITKKPNTYKGHKYKLSSIRKYRETLTFSELDEDYLNGLLRFLRYKEHLKKSSINENLKVLRRYLNIAIKKGLLEKSPFEFYKLKRVKSNPEFLTENELQVLIDLYDSNELAPTKQKTLRYFLFGTQTGMRVSDIRIARHEQIINGILRYLPVKTEDSSYKINIPLTNLAKRLIKDENPHRIKGLLFDSTKYSNLYQRLVEVVVYAGIEKNIGFHTSRHTFATLFLKKSKRANGLIVLQKLLGHARIETTMVYTHILKDDIIEAMAEFET